MKLLSLVFWCLIASTTSGEAKKRKHYTSSSYLDSYQFPDQPSSSNQHNNNGYLETEEESSGESYSDFMDRYYGQGGSNNYQMPSLGGRFDLEEGSGEDFVFCFAWGILTVVGVIHVFSVKIEFNINNIIVSISWKK